jgi:putative hydrolase of the HAD superfamily
VAIQESNYKAIVFDLGRVLVHFDFGHAYDRMEALCACPKRQMAERLFATDLVRRLETGRLDAEGFHREFCNLFQFEIGYAPFCDIWTSIFKQELIPPSLLETLKRRYRLVLLSNTNPIHFGMIREAYPHVGYFDELALSYELGALKPDDAIYRAAIDRAGCRPEECFYTDDIPDFVAGGLRAGMDSVQFKSFEQLQAELRARGIL